MVAKESELEAAVGAAFDAYERAELQTAEFTAAAAADEATVAALRRTAAAFELEAGPYIFLYQRYVLQAVRPYKHLIYLTVPEHLVHPPVPESTWFIIPLNVPYMSYNLIGCFIRRYEEPRLSCLPVCLL